MKTFRLVNQTRYQVVAERCEIADTLLSRMRGLLGRTSLEANTGLWITPCPSVHMFGMKFAIDVIFLSRELIVVDWVENLSPGAYCIAKKWENSAGELIKAHSAVELPSGTIARMELQWGDRFGREEL